MSIPYSSGICRMQVNGDRRHIGACAYIAVVRGKDDTSGVALVKGCDLEWRTCSGGL